MCDWRAFLYITSSVLLNSKSFQENSWWAGLDRQQSAPSNAYICLLYTPLVVIALLRGVAACLATNPGLAYSMPRSDRSVENLTRGPFCMTRVHSLSSEILQTQRTQKGILCTWKYEVTFYYKSPILWYRKFCGIGSCDIAYYFMISLIILKFH